MAAVGIIGIKSGMTRIFDKSGIAIPVTVVQVDPNYIMALKLPDQSGYVGLQIAAGRTQRPFRLTKPVAGRFAKLGIEPKEVLCEFRVKNPIELEGLSVGQTLTVDQFEIGDFVDVTGMTKGRGFQGCVKRHGFKMQDATHGSSLVHRAPGSIGQCQDPGRVFKGKKMAGRMGNRTRTIQNLQIIKMSNEQVHYLCVKGSIPGARGQYVCIRPAVKRYQAAGERKK